MAEFHFLGTWEDSWAVLKAILAPGDVRLVPDLNYDTPQPLFATVLDEPLKETLKTRRRVYIWSKQFSNYPPVLDCHEKGTAAGTYYVSHFANGPSLSLTLPGCYQQAEDEPVQLSSGILSYQRLYENPETGEWEKPSEELKAGYKEIQKRLKSKLVRHRFREPIWLGPDALRLIREKKAVGFGIG